MIRKFVGGDDKEHGIKRFVISTNLGTYFDDSLQGAKIKLVSDYEYRSTKTSTRQKKLPAIKVAIWAFFRIAAKSTEPDCPP